MKSFTRIGSIVFILVSLTIITPITSYTSLRFGVGIGDILEWKFTKFEGNFLGDKQSLMLIIWIELESTTFPNGTLEERISPHGLFLGETLTLVVVKVPTNSHYKRFPAVNDDFPKAIFITPRDNKTRSTAPYINSIPLIISKEPDISHLYSNCIYNDQGVLTKAKRTVRWQHYSYDSYLELVKYNQNSELPNSAYPEVFRIGLVLIFLSGWGLSIIYQKKNQNNP